jgi:hypothetical protein
MLKMRFQIVGCPPDTFEGVKHAVSTVYQMVVDRDLHQQRLEHNAIQQTGIHGIVAFMPRLPKS